MNEKNSEHIAKIEDAVKKSDKMEEEEKSNILEKLQEWRHEDEAMSLIPAKLTEISKNINPILDELGFI